jgi:hypothetical protein
VIEAIGLPHLTASKVLSSLRSQNELLRCPGLSTVRKILMEDFQLRFRAANAANIKYNDVSFDDKRVWVSRLLSQFLLAGVVVVSIDESSFKQEGVAKRFWQASSKTIRELFSSRTEPCLSTCDRLLPEQSSYQAK